METMKAIEQRRAIKHYDAAHQMTEEEIRTLMSETILSPTSFNIQNWRFVVVKDADTKKKLRAAAWNQEQVTNASICVILCADLKAAEKNPERYWRNAPENIRNTLVPMIVKYYKGDAQAQRDEAMRSCGIAAQTLMLVAKDMGYDSCPMVGFDFKKVAEIIRLPAEHIITMIVVVGKATQEARPRGGQLPLDEVCFIDHF